LARLTITSTANMFIRASVSCKVPALAIPKGGVKLRDICMLLLRFKFGYTRKLFVGPDIWVRHGSAECLMSKLIELMSTANGKVLLLAPIADVLIMWIRSDRPGRHGTLTTSNVCRR
jgi:hypothetical protein